MIITKLGGNDFVDHGHAGHDDEASLLIQLSMDGVGALLSPNVDAITIAFKTTFVFWMILHALIFLIIGIPVDALYKYFFTNLLDNVWQRVHPQQQYLRWFLNSIPTLLIFATKFFITLDTMTERLSTWSWWLLLSRGAASALAACFLQIHAQHYANTLVKLGVDQYLELEYQAQEKRILQFRPPKRLLRSTIGILDKYVVRSQIYGIENLPKKMNKVKGKNAEEEYAPGLFVMNHMLHGIESPFFINKLYEETSNGDNNDSGIYLRGLADHFHLSIPIHSNIFQTMGAVDGTRRYLDVLMKHQQHALVYPGGSYEVHRCYHEPKYKLIWKNRLGFARHAIKHGYPIIPCASVGFDDMIDRLGDLPMNVLRKDLSLSIPGPIFPHRIQRLYFWIGEPICTKRYNGDYSNDDNATQVRDLTKAAVEEGIALLRRQQDNDPERYLFPKLANAVDRLQNDKI